MSAVENLKERWNALEARERRTLMIGAIALAIIVYLFGIWLPAHRHVSELRERVAQQKASLAWMQQAAAEARALTAAGASAPMSTGGQSLFALVDQSARQAGLAGAIRQVEPSGDRKVRVNLQAANFDAMVGWLATLKTRYGIEATVLSARVTDAPGQVNAQLELEGSGA